MTKNLRPYLFFPETCQRALQFCADCLDGTIAMLQTYADAPMELSSEAADRVCNSEFRAGDLVLMASGSNARAGDAGGDKLCSVRRLF